MSHGIGLTLTRRSAKGSDARIVSEGGGPASNQTITLRRTEPQGPSVSARTAADGTFTFANLQIAKYSLSTDSSDYISEPISVVVEGGRDSKGIAIKLVKK